MDSEQKPEGQNVGSNSLLGRLRSMAKREHDDLSIGDEAADEIERLRGLLGEPLRVVVVQAIREATGCPDMLGRDGEFLSEKVLALAKQLLTPN